MAPSSWRVIKVMVDVSKSAASGSRVAAAMDSSRMNVIDYTGSGEPVPTTEILGQTIISDLWLAVGE